MWLQPSVHAQSGAAWKTGAVEKIKVLGSSLECNLEGDPGERDVFVYLPPSYASQASWRYPVVYFLHGYGATADRYWPLMTVPDAADKVMNAGTVHEFILVHPDAHTIYDGSMYSNSPTTGNWEGYITRDLVAYIDGHFRTIANRESRGLAGHSMGGYGTLRLAMKYPEVYSSIYAMSSWPDEQPRRRPWWRGGSAEAAACRASGTKRSWWARERLSQSGIGGGGRLVSEPDEFSKVLRSSE